MNRLTDVLSVLSPYPDVTLVAVSKTVDVRAITYAYDCGIRDFGENRVQDALPKMEAITLPVRWHFIGSLQTNKVRKLSGRCSLIHSLDNLPLATALSRIGRETEQEFRCLVQVNASGETTKQGLPPGDVEQFLQQVSLLSNVKVFGLMTMAPAQGEVIIRQTFRAVRRLYEEIAARPLPGVRMEYLSMGMSNDYHIALDEGSNMVRLGTAIFGGKI